MQLLGQGAAADPAGSAVHHRLHAEAAGGPGSYERLEVRGDGRGPVLSDSVHVLHVGRHRGRAVLGAAHNRRVTAGAFVVFTNLLFLDDDDDDVGIRPSSFC